MNKVIFLFVALLLSMQAKSSELLEAISANDEKLALQLITESSNLNEQDEHGVTAIYLASLRGHKKVVKKLLSLGVDLNILAHNGENALHPAADKERVEVAEMLLIAGIDLSLVNHHGDTPLDYYFNNLDHPMAIILLKYGARASKKHGS